MPAKPPRSLTKSPLALAREALAAGQRALPPQSCRYSRKDYTQAQLFAILALKQFFRTDYRGIARLLAEFAELRQALGLSKVPHYSTLCYAEVRILKKGASPGSWMPSSRGPSGSGGSAAGPRPRSTRPAWRAATPRGRTSPVPATSGSTGCGGRS